MRQLIPIKLGPDGKGWAPTGVPFAAWESVTPNALDPGTDGGAGRYGPPLVAHACDHGGKVRIVAQGGEPNTTVGVYVVWSA